MLDLSVLVAKGMPPLPWSPVAPPALKFLRSLLRNRPHPKL